jgi:tRNA-specific 2-thiouridylase
MDLRARRPKNMPATVRTRLMILKKPAVCAKRSEFRFIFSIVPLSTKNIVINNFRDEYLSARTPNPCVRCNQKLKFGVLLEAARLSGFEYDYFATGHYARVEKDLSSGRFLLTKGADLRKDQSYFLYRLNQEQLSRTIFPLGGMSKDVVRGLARRYGLSVSEKEDSQDFYSGDYRELLGVRESTGEIVNTDGIVVGSPQGFVELYSRAKKRIGSVVA